jgi:PBP1b-binding outer membrane lipoprotein LpoB
MRLGSKWAVVACALALAACSSDNDERDAMGSHLSQPPAGTRRPAPTDAGDIAIVGQDVAQDITQLPPIASASVPPLVRFNGVTSIIQPPIDTEPYTELLRDRLLLLTRAKLRFVEHTLPPYSPGKHKHTEPSPGNSSEAEYQVLAEMRGRADASSYKIQVEFVDLHSGDILYNETFRIAKESDSQPSTDEYTSGAPQGSAPPQPDQPARKKESDSGTPSTPPPGYYDPPAAKPDPGNNNGVL